MAGRKPFVPTAADRKMVKALATYAVPHEAIAAQVTNPQTGKALDAKSLRKHFRDELDSGEARSKSLIAQTLFRHSTGKGQGAVTATIFLAKTRLGWKEPPQRLEHTGAGGGPVKTKIETTDPIEAAKQYAKLMNP